jgi:hypothetical protein
MHALGGAKVRQLLSSRKTSPSIIPVVTYPVSILFAIRTEIGKLLLRIERFLLLLVPSAESHGALLNAMKYHLNEDLNGR